MDNEINNEIFSPHSCFNTTVIAVEMKQIPAARFKSSIELLLRNIEAAITAN